VIVLLLVSDRYVGTLCFANIITIIIGDYSLADLRTTVYGDILLPLLFLPVIRLAILISNFS